MNEAPITESAAAPAAPVRRTPGETSEERFSTPGQLRRKNECESSLGAGSEGPVRAFLERNHSALLSRAQKALGDRDLAQDLVHDTAVKALRGQKTLNDPDLVGAWVHSILRNTIRMHLRRCRRRDRAIARLALYARAEHSEVDSASSSRRCPCSLRALEAIPTSSRDLLLAVAIAGIPPREIARRLGIKPGNARVRLFRAKASLRLEMKRHCQRGCDLPVLTDCGCEKTRNDA